MSTIASESTEKDRRSDRRVMLVASGTLLGLFAIGVAVQAVFAFNLGAEASSPNGGMLIEVGVRTAINVAAALAVLLGAMLLKLNELTRAAKILWSLVIAGIVAISRFAVQVLIGLYEDPTWGVMLTEVGSVLLAILVSLALGLSQSSAHARVRAQERVITLHAVRAAEALEALAREELRVRRAVAEDLHGTVQNRLLLVETRIGEIVGAREHAGDLSDVEQLELVRQELRLIREHDVREMSHLLYPLGVDVGAAHAIRLLLQRVPASIAISISVDDDFASRDHLDIGQRVLLVRAAEEAITNALKHGNAGRLSVRLARPNSSEVEVTVTDNGRGFDPGTARWSGLARLADQVRTAGGNLRVEPLAAGGTSFAVTLPAGVAEDPTEQRV